MLGLRLLNLREKTQTLKNLIGVKIVTENDCMNYRINKIIKLKIYLSLAYVLLKLSKI